MDLHYCKHSARTWKILLVVLAGHTLISMEAYAQTGCPPGGSTSPHVIGQWDDNLIGPFFPTKRCSGGPQDLRPCVFTADCPSGTCVPVPSSRTPFPMHAILLKTGKVLILPTESRNGRSGDAEIYDPRFFSVMLFDPSENAAGWGEADFRKREFSVPMLPLNDPHLVPCSGHAALPDGRILFVGGEGNWPVAARGTILNPDLLSIAGDGTVTCNNCWITQPDMPNVNLPIDCPGTTGLTARYYPMVTAMGDGRMLIMGGASQAEGCQHINSEGANTPMIFDFDPTGAPRWTTLTGGRGLPGPGRSTMNPTTAGCNIGQCSLFGGLDPDDECSCANDNTRLAAQYPAHWNDGGYENLVNFPNRFHVHYYPHNILLPDGKVYMAGSLAGPYYDIEDPITLTGPFTGKFSAAGSGSWINLITDGFPVKQSATVMYRPNKLLKAGGTRKHTSGSEDPTDQAFTVDLSVSNPDWTELTPNMRWARRGINLVLLPDGKVLAATGATGSHHDPVNINCPEIWNGSSWSIMASMDEPCIEHAPCVVGVDDCCVNGMKVCHPDPNGPGPICNDVQKGNIHVRGDHSEALLLPDARVLVLGGEYHAQGTSLGNKSAQIFSPPYLFHPDGTLAERPVIALVDPTFGVDTIRYGEPTKLVVSGNVDAVSLIKLGATTHGFDMEQRYIPLSFQPISLPPTAYNYEILPPANGFEAPPGYYMLFVLNGRVPSVARIVKLMACVEAGTSPDCNNNGLPDVCDISSGTSIDCDANGIPDECPCSNCPCPLGLISTTVAASPPHLTRDARQPHPPNDNRLVARQGIGSAGEPITITMMNPLCGNVGPQCFGLCETGIEQTDGTPMDGVALTANQIVSVTKRTSPDKTYDIVLARPISAGHWTLIKYWSGSKKIIYSSLPGDVNIDGVSQSSSPSDVEYLDDCLAGSAFCPTVYRRDMDHSGSLEIEVADVTRLNQLLAGSETFIEWEGRTLPSNICNQSGGGGPYCPDANCGGGTDPQAMSMGFGLESLGEIESLEEGEITVELTENQEHANALAELLTTSNPTTTAELDFFETSVATLTQFAVANFSAEERIVLVNWLSDPFREYASAIGQSTAAEVVAVLVQP